MSRMVVMSTFSRVLMGLLASLLAVPLMAATCSKTVRWLDDPPYAVRSANGQIEGIDADLITEILRRMGCKPVFVEMPWARALAELEAGRLDVLPAAFKTADREKYATFSIPIYRSANVLFMSQRAEASYHFTHLADLADSDFRLGTQIKAYFGAEYEALLANPAFKARIYTVNQRASGWKMIDANRLDGMIADQFTGTIELQQLGLSEVIVKSNVVLSNDPSMVAFSRKSVSAGWVDQFNRALQTMKADGTYRRIMARYLHCKFSVEKLSCL